MNRAPGPYSAPIIGCGHVPAAVELIRRVRPASEAGQAAVELIRRIRPASEAGQAAVELIALLPLILTAGLAGAAVLAGQAAGEQAGQAAQAGAMALLQEGDPRAAARNALPATVRSRARIEVHGRRVTVHVRPRVPLPPLADTLTADATADAGPEPPP
jgi:hypothetical protein